MVLDNPAAFPHEENLGLEIIREESNAPLLPPRPPPPDSHPPPPPPPHSFSRPRRIPQETSESFFPLLTNEHTDEQTHSPNHRDSLYTSMPVLTDLPDGQMNGLTDGEEESSGELQPCKSATAPELDDVYYKSMPNLGSRNHLHELQTYYHMGRGGSDGYMVSGNRGGVRFVARGAARRPFPPGYQSIEPIKRLVSYPSPAHFHTSNLPMKTFCVVDRQTELARPWIDVLCVCVTLNCGSWQYGWEYHWSISKAGTECIVIKWCTLRAWAVLWETFSETSNRNGTFNLERRGGGGIL